MKELLIDLIKKYNNALVIEDYAEYSDRKFYARVNNSNTGEIKEFRYKGFYNLVNRIKKYFEGGI